MKVYVKPTDARNYSVPSTELIIISVRHFFTISLHLYCHSTMYRKDSLFSAVIRFHSSLLPYVFVFWFLGFNWCVRATFVHSFVDVQIARCHLIKWIRYRCYCGIRTETKAFNTKEKHIQLKINIEYIHKLNHIFNVTK